MQYLIDIGTQKRKLGPFYLAPRNQAWWNSTICIFWIQRQIGHWKLRSAVLDHHVIQHQHSFANVEKWYIESEISLYSKELQNIIYNFFYDISGTFVSLFIKTNFCKKLSWFFSSYGPSYSIYLVPSKFLQPLQQFSCQITIFPANLPTDVNNFNIIYVSEIALGFIWLIEKISTL